MQVLAITFYDEDGNEHVGELVNASTVLGNNGKTVTADIVRDRSDEILVVTYGPSDEWITHNVLIGNVTALRPMELS